MYVSALNNRKSLSNEKRPFFIRSSRHFFQHLRISITILYPFSSGDFATSGNVFHLIPILVIFLNLLHLLFLHLPSSTFISLPVVQALLHCLPTGLHFKLDPQISFSISVVIGLEKNRRGNKKTGN